MPRPWRGPGTACGAAGRSASVPGTPRKVASCSRVTTASTSWAWRAAGNSSPRASAKVSISSSGRWPIHRPPPRARRRGTALASVARRVRVRSKTNCTGELERGREQADRSPCGRDEVHVHDRRGAERRHVADQRRRRRRARAATAGGDGHDDRVGLEVRSPRYAPTSGPAPRPAGVDRRPPACRARSRPPRRRGPAAPARRAAGRGGPSDQPMSPASARSSRPVRKTFAARASDASSAGRLSGRQRDQVPQPIDGARPLSVAAQPGAERLVVERRVVGSRRRSASGRQPDARSLAIGRGPVAGQGAGQVQRGRQRDRAMPSERPTRREHRDVQAGLEERPCRRRARSGRAAPGRRCSNAGRRAGRCRTSGPRAGTTR